MTRIDRVRRAADVTKDSVRYAAQVAAPYASTARESAARYGRQAGVHGVRYGRLAGHAARQGYDALLAERVTQARAQAWAALPPRAASTVETAARRTRESARAATDYAAPRVGEAVTATRSLAAPAREEAVLRGTAALHALRGSVSAADIDRLVRRRVRRRQAGRVLRGMVVMTFAGGAAVAAWKWWTRQTSPEWLVEPAEAGEAGGPDEDHGATLTVVDPLDDHTTTVNGSAPQPTSTADSTPPSDQEDRHVRSSHRRKKHGG